MEEFYAILTMKKRRAAALGRAGGTKTGLTDSQEREITDDLRNAWLKPTSGSSRQAERKKQGDERIR